MSSGFWSKNNKAIEQQEAILQAQAPEQEVETEEVSLLDYMGTSGEPEKTQEECDEEQEMAEVMSNANLRLEQGRLYQMLISNDIFQNMDADPKAVRNVQRQIRNYAIEMMEKMLGMRQDLPAKTQEVVVSSPFNELEVVALKAIAAQMSKGATTKADKPQATAPKKETLTPISGTTKRDTMTPIQESKPLPKNRTAPVAPKAAAVSTPKQSALQPASVLDESFLTKPINEMTPEELIEYEKKSAERQQKLRSALPTGLVPMPSPQQQEAMYASRISEVLSRPGSAMNGMLGILSKR